MIAWQWAIGAFFAGFGVALLLVRVIVLPLVVDPFRR
jgi:hypothetical protein